MIIRNYWLPSLLTITSVLVLWLSCGMLGAHGMNGYPFLFLYFGAVFSLFVGVPLLTVIDIAFIIFKLKSFKQNGFHVWPYYCALILGVGSMALFLIVHIYLRYNTPNEISLF
jgi:nitric oxide reductase large subunit